MSAVGRVVGLAAAAVVIAAGAYALLFPLPWQHDSSASGGAGGRAPAKAAASEAPSADGVTLGDEELKTVKVEAVGMRAFGVARDAVGKIAFNDDASVPVFPPYQGRITQLFVKPGE